MKTTIASWGLCWDIMLVWFGLRLGCRAKGKGLLAGWLSPASNFCEVPQQRACLKYRILPPEYLPAFFWKHHPKP